jgi:hypothetical protein
MMDEKTSGYLQSGESLWAPRCVSI